MELSICDAELRFAEAVAAATRGERVVITKQGRPFLELVLARGVGGMSDERAAAVRRELGLEGLTVRFSPEFDDPAFSRAVLRVAD